MNSIYRKCSRRVLRLVAREATNIFNPTTLDYLLIGSLKDLQAHFHLTPLLLPKDTMSVVTDTRFVFQPALRLSRTKGTVDVIITVGSQFVQITTVKPQDIGPGFRLSGTVNDIFRVAELEEAKPASSIDGDTTFGFKIDNGKVVMYFDSPRKQDVLQAIRSAKAQYRKEIKSAHSMDRLIRPDDVPGSLLNVSLMNLSSHDRTLRLASYNTIAALSKTFQFGIGRDLITAKEIEIPARSANLVRQISQKLAVSEPGLTHDFLSEFFIGWDRLSDEERPMSVLYMSPWLQNLQRHVILSDQDSEKGRDKVAAIARKLLETAIRTPSCDTCFQDHAWPVVAKDDALVDVFLDEMVKIALEYGPDATQVEAIACIATSIGSMTLRGKVIARLRKVLNRSSLRPTRALVDNAIWDELAVLLRICVDGSFDHRGQSQLFLPEIFHIITMTVHSGSSIVSSYVHSLLINTVHSLCTTFPLNDSRLTKLQTLMVSLTEPKVEVLFDLRHVASGDAPVRIDTKSPDAAMFSHLETITVLLQSIIELGAPSNALANSWRSRWMSLVASTAFQSNPAVQPKAFTVMGCLASENVDDDILYQVLVSLRTGISRFTDEGDGGLLIAIATTMTKMVKHLSPSSRYIRPMFWLATALVRLVPLPIFNCAVSLLEAVILVLAKSGVFKGGQMTSSLLQARHAARSLLSEMDEVFDIHFNSQNFHVAMSICLLKGLHESWTQASAMRVLFTLLEVISMSTTERGPTPQNKVALPYVLLLSAHATTVDEWRDRLWFAGSTPPMGLASPADTFDLTSIDQVEDQLLLCNAMLVVASFTTSDDVVQQHVLQFLLQFATRRPSVFSLL
ncbi:MAG: Ras GTPase activating protein ira2 [Phylliscum demangeonii]|nr:MAG: Ras GTPase activating protein ira2 [Phylliscum demangeonii]